MQLLQRIPSAAENFVNQFSQGLGARVQEKFSARDKLSQIDSEKQLEKRASIENGLSTIDKMRGLISSAGPTNYIPGLLGGETTKRRAELQALGRSLIPLVAAGVPVRNQREFEEYSKVITNPNSRQAELEGALNGIESVLSSSISRNSKTSSDSSDNKKVKFSSDNPEHRKKAEQLYKTYKDKKKVQDLLSREFEF